MYFSNNNLNIQTLVVTNNTYIICKGFYVHKEWAPEISGAPKMSTENEARERRRNRLLQSKEERMSRILGSNESKMGEVKEEPKMEPRPSVAINEQVKRPLQKTPSATAKVVHSATPSSQSAKSEKIGATVEVKLTGRGHVLVIAVVASLFSAALIFFGTSSCQHIIGRHCDTLSSSAYIVMISVFCGLESIEFLTGRLELSDGMASVYMLLKDFALYLLIVLISTTFRSY